MSWARARVCRLPGSRLQAARVRRPDPQLHGRKLRGGFRSSSSWVGFVPSSFFVFVLGIRSWGRNRFKKKNVLRAPCGGCGAGPPCGIHDPAPASAGRGSVMYAQRENDRHHRIRAPNPQPKKKKFNLFWGSGGFRSSSPVWVSVQQLRGRPFFLFVFYLLYRSNLRRQARACPCSRTDACT